ncbi:MAG: hypothetical protein WBX06_07110, partial [Acidobacteriaceae bacterium]
MQYQIAEPSGPQQSWIERIQPISRRQNDNISPTFQAINLSHKSVQHAVVNSVGFSPSGADRIDFTEKHNDRHFRFC